MAKVVLEFDADTEKHQLLAAVKAIDLAIVIEDVLAAIRGELRYNEELGECCEKKLEELRVSVSNNLIERDIEGLICG